MKTRTGADPKDSCTVKPKMFAVVDSERDPVWAYDCNCKILEVASYSNLNNYRGSAVQDIRTPLVDSN